MFLRIGLCGIAQGPISVSFIKMFHALEVPLFVLPIFRYITLHFDTKLSATIYMVGYSVSAQVGQIILSGPLELYASHWVSTYFLCYFNYRLISRNFRFYNIKKRQRIRLRSILL